jgi:hypothetical protein
MKIKLLINDFRYQRGVNQKSKIKGQTTQWPKEKGIKGQTTIYKHCTEN